MKGKSAASVALALDGRLGGEDFVQAALEGAALNVRINLKNLNDPEFVGWKEDELQSLRSTGTLMLEEIQGLVDEQMQK